jgi:cytidine deaminase
MQVQRIITEIDVYEHRRDLEPGFQDLLEEAEKAMNRAYAPYSGFRVGAAIRLENGVIVHGNNQENVAYPSGLCAERVAFFNVGANYPGHRISAVAIVASSESFPSDHPVSPCGACRQSMLEYQLMQAEPIHLIMSGLKGNVFVVKGLQHLLPVYFNEAGLKQC